MRALVPLVPASATAEEFGLRGGALRIEYTHCDWTLNGPVHTGRSDR